MILTSTQSSSYGYGLNNQQAQPSQQANIDQTDKRTTYGTKLLQHMDDRAYQAFQNATANDRVHERSFYADVLEKSLAKSAANQYTLTHDIDETNDIEVVYAFFESYHDVVSTEEIKHLLNTKLQSDGHLPHDQEKIESFFNDYIAQLGGVRNLDIMV
ncbi:MAG: hypothetical protein OEW60_05915 [Thiovulaceae bacterium]|nr:hypothetical protein [Sulfurimonadaceae bacterium]